MKKIFLICFTFILLLACTNNTKKTPNQENDHAKPTTNEGEFSILNVSQNQAKTTYLVSQKGFRDNIKIAFTIVTNDIKDIEIIRHYETNTYFNRIKNADYLEKIITSADISEIDTISGATISSKALKHAAINTLDYHERNK